MISPIPEPFATLVHKRLDALGLSASELARSIRPQTTPQRVCDVLKGRRLPPRDALAAWMDALAIQSDAQQARWKESYRLSAAERVEFSADGVALLQHKLMQSQEENRALADENRRLRRMLKLAD